jgi:hypothetical protein
MHRQDWETMMPLTIPLTMAKRLVAAAICALALTAADAPDALALHDCPDGIGDGSALRCAQLADADAYVPISNLRVVAKSLAEQTLQFEIAGLAVDPFAYDAAAMVGYHLVGLRPRGELCPYLANIATRSQVETTDWLGLHYRITLIVPSPVADVMMRAQCAVAPKTDEEA